MAECTEWKERTCHYLLNTICPFQNKVNSYLPGQNKSSLILFIVGQKKFLFRVYIQTMAFVKPKYFVVTHIMKNNKKRQIVPFVNIPVLRSRGVLQHVRIKL